MREARHVTARHVTWSTCRQGIYLHRTCRNCIRTIRSGYNDEPSGHDMVAVIGACNVHASPVIRPQRPPSAHLPSLHLSLVLHHHCTCPSCCGAPVTAPPVPATPRSAVVTSTAPAPPVPAPTPPVPAPTPQVSCYHGSSELVFSTSTLPSLGNLNPCFYLV